jgi:hypothetical protein
LCEFCDIQNPVHATDLPQRILATDPRKECRSHFDEHIDRRRTLQDIGDGPSRSTRKGGPTPRTKLHLSPSAMIDWHAGAVMISAGATVDPISEPDLEAVWSAEIERCLVEIDAGTVELIPWDDVRLELCGDVE